MREFYQIIRRAQVVRPVGETEDRLYPPKTIFEGSKKDRNLQRLVRINAVRKLEDIEVDQLGLLNKQDENDIIVVLD